MSNDLSIKFKEEKFIILHYSNKSINLDILFDDMFFLLDQKQIIFVTIFPKPIG